MSKIHSQFSFAALEAFQESHPDTNTLDAILTFTEERFIENFQTDFNGDTRKARQVYREAQQANEQIVLLWANLKDTIASPSVSQGLYNNISIPESFIRHQRTVPSYNHFFGNLDYREYDACRSIFGPAAYFVDLMRFIEKHIPQTGDGAPPIEHTLAARQPGLFTLPLDCDNTYTLIPYIDLINEVLEAVVRNNQTYPEETLDAASFPMSLPVNLPLEEIRLYLAQLKLDLQTIYSLFGVPAPLVTRELLTLSPRDYEILTSQLASKADRDIFYGMDTALTGRTGLDNVEMFTQQTGLSRSELNTLLFGDLSNEEIAAGLPRLQFINNTGDGAGHLYIEEDIQLELFRFTGSSADITMLDSRDVPQSLLSALDHNNLEHSEIQELHILVDAPGEVWRLWDSLHQITYTLTRKSATEISVFDQPFDRLVGLTPRKLDRIYRFLKLARALNWSFTELDWAIRSFQNTDNGEQVLRFDGVNDFVAIENAVNLAPESTSRPVTLEAWVLPSQGGIHPILAKGQQETGRTDFSWWITPTGKLAFFNRVGVPSFNEVNATGADEDNSQPNERNRWRDAFLETGSYPFAKRTVDHRPLLVEIVEETAGLNLVGERALPTDTFSHVAVTINNPVVLTDHPGNQKNYYQLAFYINGQLDSTWTLTRAIPIGSDGSSVYIGRDFNHSFFTGQLTEVRLWHSLRSELEIANGRFRRLTGREPGLAAYWPLTASVDLLAHDFAIAHQDTLTDLRDRNPGKLGGDSHHALPVWTQGTLALDSLPRPISTEYRYHFNGRDTYVGNSLGAGASALTLSVLTIEAWVEIIGSGTHPLVTFGEVENGRVRYGLSVNSSSQLVFSSDSLSADLVSSTALSANQLTHVAVTVSASDITLFINGTESGTVSSAIMAESWGNTLYLGRDFASSPTDGNILHGTLQEVRIWNQVKTPDLSRFHQLTGTEPGLVGYWRLDEPERVRARDRTFNGNHLIPGGLITIYQPQLATHDEVILPDPVASAAAALTFTPESYPIALENQRQYGLGRREQFTLQLWFRASNLDLPAPQLLFAQGESEVGVALYLAGGELHAYGWCADFDGTAPTTTQARVHLSGGGDQINLNTWHHLTLTYDETHADGIEFRLYCDGIQLGATTDGFRLDPIGHSCLGGLTPDCTVRIASANGDDGAVTAGLGLAGQLSDLRIWQGAIDHADLLQTSPHYDQRHSLPQPDAALVCYAPLTEDYGRSVSDHVGPRYVEIAPDGPELPDQSPNRNHARLYVGPDDVESKWQPALELPIFPDRVLRLDGSQVLRLPDASRLSLVNQPFTIELWLRMTAIPDTPTRLLSASNLELWVTPAGLALRSQHQPATIASTPNLATGWHHLAWRYDGERHTLFIDGVNAGNTDASGIEQTGAVVLGATETSLDWQVSELRVWQASRSDAEIGQNWQLKLTPEMPGLLAYWEFPQDPSQTFVDRTAQGLQASLSAPPTDNQWYQPDSVPPTFGRQSQALGLNNPDTPDSVTYPGVTPNFVDLAATITPSGTLELWVEFAAVANAAVDSILLDASGTQPFVLAVRNGNLVFETGNQAGTLTTVSLPIASTGPQHLAIVWQFDPNQTQLGLVLGDQETVATTPEGGLAEFATLRLGLNHTDKFDAIRPFRGRIAQLRIWDHVRSFHTLQHLAEADLEGNEIGLLHCVPFDEATGDSVRDLVTGATLKLRALAVEHPEPRWVDGDWALQFNGADRYIELPTYQPLSSGSIELWAKFSLQLRGRNQLEDGSLFDASTDSSDDNNVNKFFYLKLEDNRFEFGLEEDVNDKNHFLQFSLRNRNIEDFVQQWHHIVASWQVTANQLVMKLTVDGEQQQETRTADQAITLPTFQTLYIGQRRSTYPSRLNNVDAFEGQIRQVSIWDRPVTDADATLLHYLPLDEGTGTALGGGATLVTGTGNDEPWILLDRAVAFTGFTRPDFAPETFVDIPTTLPANTGTLELWTRFNPAGDERILLDASTVDLRFCLKVVNGSLVLQVGSGEATLPLTSQQFATSWHHIAASWRWLADPQQLTLTLQIDGTVPVVIETSQADPVVPQTPYLGLARLPQATLADGRPFDGDISQLRVWSQVRDAATLRRLRFANLTGLESGLVSYLPIEAGVGRQLSDRTGQADAVLRLGIFAGLPTWVQTSPRLFRFDGSVAAVVRPQVFSAIASTSATLELWLSLDTTAGPQPLLGTITPKIATEAAFSLQVVDGVLQVRLPGHILSADDLPLTANTWHRLTCQYNSEQQQLRLGVDGSTSINTLDLAPDLAPLALDRHLYIGLQRQWDQAGQTWNETFLTGTLAELRIWSNLVGSDTSDLAAPLARRLRGDETDLVAHWLFTGGSQAALMASGSQPLRGYAIAPSPPITQPARGLVQQPPIYTRRPAPILDGYNDYLALGDTALDLTAPHTVEFWHRDSDWQHVAAVYGTGGAVERLYLNGQVVDANGQVVDAQNLAAELSRLQVVWANRVAGDHPETVRSGQVAELRLWQGQRSAEQINADQYRFLNGREPDLGGYWPLNEGQSDSLQDTAEYLAPATLIVGLENGAEKWAQPAPPIPKAKSALFFDGLDDRVSLPDLAQLNLDGSFTLEAWVKPEVSGQQPILGTAQTQPDQPLVFIGFVEGHPTLQLGNWAYWQAEQKLDSSWHHVAWSVDATNPDSLQISLFVSGESRSVTNQLSDSAPSPQPLTGAAALAAHRWTQTEASAHFRGGIGQVRLWQVARSQEDIRSYRNRPLPGTSKVFATLIADWIFDDRNETILLAQIPSVDQTAPVNCYYLRWQSDMNRDQPVWTEIEDHPIVTDVLPQQALAFDGRHQFAAAEVDLPQTDWTLETWVKVNDLSTHRPILWWGDSTSAPVLELRVSTVGQLELMVGSSDPITSTVPLSVDILTHVAAVLADKTLTLFINGISNGSGTISDLDQATLQQTGLRLQVGRSEARDGEAPTLFSGLIQFLRIWDTAQLAAGATAGEFQLTTNFYTPADPTAGPVAVWPLSTVLSVDQPHRITPNQIESGPALTLGGLGNSRTPSAGQPTQLIDARRRVLTLSADKTSDFPQTVQLPHLAEPLHQDRTRRLIEVWFRCENPAETVLQTIYAEWDQEWQLQIAIQGGELIFETSRQPDETAPDSAPFAGKQSLAIPEWQGSRIVTERVQPGHWHHAVLVLDSRSELRDDAFCAVLDGQVIGVQPGLQLPGQPTQLAVGGLTFTPVTGDPTASFEAEVIVANALNGQIADVYIWEADAAGELPEIGLDTNTAGHLLWHWQTSQTSGLAAPMRVPDLTDTGSGSPHLPLADLAQLRSLRTYFDQPVITLCALWFDLRHIGTADGRTLYDSIFNPVGTDAADRWSYTNRRRWQVNSTDAEHRQIRTRLMGTLRVSSQDDLLAMVNAVSGTAVDVVTLEGRYLTHLYRIRLLSSLLGLSIADTLGLIAILQNAEQELATPISAITDLTVRDVQQLQERTDWLRRTGIDLSEYRFLVYDEQDNRTTVPYTDSSLIDGVVTLLDTARAFLLTPTSFISEDVTEAASIAIYNDLRQRSQIKEFDLYIPAADGSTGQVESVSIVLPNVSFTQTHLAEPTILQELGWQVVDGGIITALPPFESLPVVLRQPGLTVSSQDLRDQGWLAENGLVAASPDNYPVSVLREWVQSLFNLSSSSEVDTEKLILLRDLLTQRYDAQTAIPASVTEQLNTLRQGLIETIENSFVDLLETDRDRIRTLIQLTTGKTFDQGEINAEIILTQAGAIAKTRSVDSQNRWVQDLAQLYKTLFLLSQYDLSTEENTALLSTPTLFGLSADRLITPQYVDLNALYTFISLKADLSDAGNQLLSVLENEHQLGSLTPWTAPEIEQLRTAFVITAATNTLPVLDQLTTAFRLIHTLGADAQYLIDLADTNQLDIAFYQRHASTLFDLVRAQYDDSRWPGVFKPLHDRLSTRRRDSLLAYILEDLADVLRDRKDPNILYEYLLLDVQTGSEVDTSRIVQATASLQLYVQRCLMNLEQGVRPEQIPTDEWEWMKNYRVWEANRKVFLYPENFIEPELRDTKTPQFQTLMDELLQNEVNQENVEAAYKRYLDQFAAVSNLTIVGSYVDTDRLPSGTHALNFNRTATAHFTIGQTLATVASQLTREFTLALWIKPIDSTTGGLLGAYNWTGSEQKGWNLRISQRKVYCYISTQDQLNQNGGRLTAVSSQALDVNRWYHVAATYRSGQLILFINGEEVARNTQRTGDISYPDTNDRRIPFTLGALLDRDNRPPDYHFKGSLRSVEVWKVARTVAQIQTAMVQGVANPNAEEDLVHYWPMDEGRGEVVRDLAPEPNPDESTRRNLQMPQPGITWVSAPANGLISQGNIDSHKTLYLVGRNDNTQEYYFRRWLNEDRWEPWQKIDQAIKATSVSPVFAFNRLFLFWVEMSESVRAEDRRWVENNDNGRLLDQLGEEILVRSRQQVGSGDNRRSLSQTLVDGRRIDVASAGVDSIDGGLIKTDGSFVVYNPSLNNLPEQVNVPVQKVAIKYTYYTFSGDWMQPQTLAGKVLNNIELNESEMRQPKWQRVYAQRWRTSDVAAPVQPDPAPIARLAVAQLGPNSVVTQTVSTFDTVDLTLSFWLRANNLIQPTETVEPPLVQTVSLFNYGSSNRFRADLTQISSPITGRLEMQTIADESEQAVTLLTSSFEAIRDFRSGNLLGSLDNVQSAVKNQLSQLQSLPSFVDARQANLVNDLMSAVSFLDDALDLIKNDRTLEQPMLFILNAGIDAAAAAVTLFGSRPTTAPLDRTRATAALDSARTDQSTITAAVEQVSAENVKETPNSDTINAATDTAVQAVIDGLSKLVPVFSMAKSAEDQVPKYSLDRLNAKLELTIDGSTQTLSDMFPYGRWYHISLILEHSTVAQAGQYTITSSIHADGQDSIDVTSLTFSSSLLPQGSTLQIGSETNPSVTASDGGQFAPWMSEFRLWNYQRTSAEIERDRNFRLHGRETGLMLHLPLHNQPEVTRVDDQAPQLSLQQVFAPQVSSTTRERIVLIYGNSIIQTLRNTLKDVGFNYTLKENTDAQDSYVLALSNTETGAIVGYDTDAKLILESYRQDSNPNDQTEPVHPYDRFLPQDRDVLNTDISSADKPQDLNSQIIAWNGQNYDPVDQALLKNNSESQIKVDEAYILDVPNQPSWYILDIGDEIFLVRLFLQNPTLAELYVQTIEERLRALQTNPDNTQKAFDLFIDRDFALEVGNSNGQRFDFFRLNTFAVQTLSELLFAGIDELLSLDTQITVQEPDFGNLQVDQPGDNPQITASGYFPEQELALRNPIDFEGAYGPYYQEIFFHIPFLIANQLSANQQFAEAQRWYHYIFDPTAQESGIAANGATNSKDRYWRYRPFRGLDLESLSEMLTNTKALAAYRTDPFDPHAIAQLRINTYQKTVVMKYIDNLVNWADNLFRQDTRESITEATQLYVLAFTLLGPRPTAKPVRETDAIGTYVDIRDRLLRSRQEDASNQRRDTSEEDYRNLLPDFVGDSRPEPPAPRVIPFDPNRSVITDFGVPENAQFLSYWDTVDDRLFKIRHSLNIDGIFRSQALFQPPIDPAALVNAAASGLAGGFGNALASAQAVVPHYRYGNTLEKAKEMVGYVIDFGAALTDALANRGEEDLLLLQHAQELKILEMTTALKELELVQAEKNIEGLNLSLSGANQRKQNFQSLIDEFMSPLEGTEIAVQFTAAIFSGISGGLKITSAVTSAIPEINVGAAGFGGSPVAEASVSGEQISTPFYRTSEFFDLLADIANNSAGILGKFAGYERRKREWEQSRTEVENEIEQIETQIEAARAQVEAATREIAMHNQLVTHHKEVGEFYRRKFFNRDLRIWLSNRLSSLYFQAYKIAFDLAKQAERAYQFEFGSNGTYLSFGYWDSRRKGLLAGESLRLDLMRLEKAAHDQDSRYLEITKTISLARIDPLAFLQLRDTGRCQFSLGELLFDRDYPGHYFRIIKSLEISIPAVVGPYESVHATLTQTGHKTLLSPDVSGVQYMLGEIAEMPGSIRVDWRANQQIAISTGVEDSGLFELDFNDNRYLPFENTGAVSNWILELPKETNRFDFASITDVVIHLRYMCLADNGSFRQAVMDLDAFKNYRGSRLFSVAHEFSAQWFAFTQDRDNNSELVLTLPNNTLPPNINPTQLAAVPLYGVAPDGTLVALDDKAFEVVASTLPRQPATVTLKANRIDPAITNLLLLVLYEGTLN